MFMLGKYISVKTTALKILRHQSLRKVNTLILGLSS